MSGTRTARERCGFVQGRSPAGWPRGNLMHDPSGAMSLRFVGVDPDTPNGGSPTVWLEDEKAEIVIQGWLPDSEMHTEIAGTEWVEGHPSP